MVHDKAIQTNADVGTKENPLSLDDDDDPLDDHGAVSGDEETEPVPDDDKFLFEMAFEKVDEFDHHLDEPNPWHEDLNKPLFPSQIIGFRWMAHRHSKGGGLVGDKVGCGKVFRTHFEIILMIDISMYQLYPLAPRSCQRELCGRRRCPQKPLPSGRFQRPLSRRLAQHAQQSTPPRNYETTVGF